MRAATITSRIGVRLLRGDELTAAPCPEACIEVTFDPVRPARDADMVLAPAPLRITPTDLVRLRVEAELVLGEVRAEVMGAEIEWRRRLGLWYEEGRQAVDAQEPDAALLVRVLEALRKKDLAPV